MKETFKCILFDGENITKNAIVTIENNVVVSIEKETKNSNTEYFMMPSLIDAHTHISSINQVDKMMSYGIGATFDVSASPSLIKKSSNFNIISSINMAMAMIFNPKKFVKNAIACGAKYIKVLLFGSLFISSRTLKAIVKEAHKKELKVVVHATKMKTYKQAVKCGADIILHLPMKNKLTDKFAKLIAEKDIYVVPTLIMMETFSKRKIFFYKEKHFLNALKQVETLYKNGVQILTGTDANTGYFAPAVSYGDSLYQEINLLLKAGLPLLEVLKGTTSKAGQAFNMNLGKIEIGKPANVLLFNIQNEHIDINYDNLKRIWINGKEIKQKD